MPSFDGTAYVIRTSESSSIDYNNGTITTARMTVTLSSYDEYRINYYLSANGGVNWEEVSNGILKTFTNTGTDLRWKIIGIGGVRVIKIVIDSYH